VPWYRFEVCAYERSPIRAMGGIRVVVPRSFRGSIAPIRSSSPAGDVDDLPPIVLAALVHRTDPERLPGHDRVLHLKARERLVSHHQAGSLEAVESITRCLPPGYAGDDDGVLLPAPRWEFASDEVRAALCLTRHGAEQRAGE